MRAYISDSSYPAYKHRSFNLEMKGRTTWHLSLHVKYSYADRGFWFGIRPEIEIHRHADRIEKEFTRMREARRYCHCDRCGKVRLGQVGMRLPKGWDFIHMLEFCDECVDSCSYKELMRLSPGRKRK